MALSPAFQNLLRIAWLAALAAVATGSLLPDTSAPIQALSRLPVSDKVDHAIGYAALAFLPALHESRKRLLLIAATCVGIGILLEIIQPSFGRDYERADMAADAAGVTAGLALGLLPRRLIARR